MNTEQRDKAVPIYWTLLNDAEWSLHMAATKEGLCFVGSHNQAIDELIDWAQTRYPGSPIIRDDEMLLPYVKELLEYLRGERKIFSKPIDVRGTPFQIAVWNALSEIPYGLTKSYSDIAQHIQKPFSVRAVGTAIGANPLLITVPCHRVIGKNGSLTGYRGGLEMKTRLLELEKKDLVIPAEGSRLRVSTS
ncbi:MAG: methylated-DNA--[protein]-cysteine S-methyltransferase [Bacillota bacterium]